MNDEIIPGFFNVTGKETTYVSSGKIVKINTPKVVHSFTINSGAIYRLHKCINCGYIYITLGKGEYKFLIEPRPDNLIFRYCEDCRYGNTDDINPLPLEEHKVGKSASISARLKIH